MSNARIGIDFEPFADVTYRVSDSTENLLILSRAFTSSMERKTHRIRLSQQLSQFNFVSP